MLEIIEAFKNPQVLSALGVFGVLSIAVGTITIKSWLNISETAHNIESTKNFAKLYEERITELAEQLKEMKANKNVLTGELERILDQFLVIKEQYLNIKVSYETMAEQVKSYERLVCAQSGKIESQSKKIVQLTARIEELAAENRRLSLIVERRSDL